MDISLQYVYITPSGLLDLSMRRPVFAVKGRRLNDISYSKTIVKHSSHTIFLIYYASQKLSRVDGYF